MYPGAASAALLSLSSLLWPGLAGAHPASPSPLVARDVGECKMPAFTNIASSAGFNFGFDARCARSTGVMVGWWILVDFPDAPADAGEEATLVNEFWPRVAEWYRNSSYNMLDLGFAGDSSTFFRMPEPSTHYGWNSLTTEKHYIYIHDAIAAVLAAGGTRPSNTDVIYIIPTKKASAISYTTTYNNVAAVNGMAYAERAVTIGQDAYTGLEFKSFVFGTAFAMCLPNYQAASGDPKNRFVGGWSVLGNPAGPAPDLFAWDKWRLGWIPDEDVACVSTKGSTTHVLSPLWSVTGLRAVVIAYGATQVLVAEFRTGLAWGIDQDICAVGILLYTVDTTVASGDGPIRVLDAAPNTNGCQEDPLNDATLNIAAYRNTPSYTFDNKITITVVEQNTDNMTIKVDYA